MTSPNRSHKSLPKTSQEPPQTSQRPSQERFRITFSSQNEPPNHNCRAKNLNFGGRRHGTCPFELNINPFKISQKLDESSVFSSILEKKWSRFASQSQVKTLLKSIRRRPKSLWVITEAQKTSQRPPKGFPRAFPDLPMTLKARFWVQF